MNKNFSLIMIVILPIVLIGCGLRPTASPAPTALPPTLTPTELPLPTNTPPPTAPAQPEVTQPPPSPTSPPPTITPLPTVPPLTPTAALPAWAHNPYAVILVPSGDTLNVRQNPDPNSSIVDQLAADAVNILLTGKEVTVGDQRWVEIQRPSDSTGWVNAYYLTEYVSAASFCADQQATTLITNLDTALTIQDGNLLSSLVSPAHGLNVQYFHTGNVANYTPEEAKWLFVSTYVMNWGMHPASGLDVKGSFHQEVLPLLIDAFNSQYTLTCDNLTLGPNSYLYQWPPEYRNIHFYSLYKPGTPGVDLDWRTWLVGTEYVNGRPYLYSLIHLFWEP